MFFPAIHLLTLVNNELSRGGFQGSRFALWWTCRSFDTFIHGPNIACCRSIFNVLTQLHPVVICTASDQLLGLIPGLPKLAQVFTTGVLIVITLNLPLFSIIGLRILDFASNQSDDLVFFLPKVASAQLCIADFKDCQRFPAGSDSFVEYSFSKRSVNCDTSTGSCMFAVFRRGFPLAFQKNIFFGQSLILQQTSKWSVSQSALW